MIIPTFFKVMNGKIAFRFRDQNKGNCYTNWITDFKPKLYVESSNGKSDCEKVSYFGKPVNERTFDSIKKARDWVSELKDTPIRYHGNYNFAQQYVLSLLESQPIQTSSSDVRILYFDIETYSPDGFPHPEEAKYPINAITVYDSFTNIYHAIATCDYSKEKDETNKDLAIKFTKCDSEEALCKKFIDLVNDIDPDIITGFNSAGFDVPYIVNRFEKVLGETETKRLSPFGIVNKKIVKDKTFFNVKDKLEVDIFGFAHLDYKLVYEKHAYTTLDSYSLNSIAEHEIGVKKLSYEEEGSLHNLFVVNPQKFVEYNIKDVKLMVDIENKRKLFDKLIAITFLTYSNFEDTMGTKRLWENRLAYTLSKTNKVPIYDVKLSGENKPLVGAFVREPKVGRNKWGIVMDAASLYPSLIMQYGMDLASHIPYHKLPQALRNIKDKYSFDDLLNQKIDLSILKDYNVSMTANFEFFDKSVDGVIPQECRYLFGERKSVQKESKGAFAKANEFIQFEKELTKEYYDLMLKAGQKDTLQHGLKILLNSLYGAITLQYFNYFKFEIGEAITTTGQLVNKHVGNTINKFMKTVVFENDEKYKDYEFIEYGDTDSVMVDLNPVVEEFGYANKSDRETTEFLLEFVAEILEPVVKQGNQQLADYTNAVENRMDWEFEAMFSTVIFVAKKKYVMKLVNKDGMDCVDHPKWKITGMESVKKAAYPKCATTMLEKAYKICVNESEENLQEYVSECKKEFEKMDYSDIAIPTGVNGLEKYYSSTDIYTKGAPKHVKAALIHNHLLKVKDLKHIEEIKSGNKIKYLELKKINPLNQEVIGFQNFLPKEFELERYVDKDKMFDKGFITPLEKILDVLHWDAKKVNKVSNFFDIC